MFDELKGALHFQFGGKGTEQAPRKPLVLKGSLSERAWSAPLPLVLSVINCTYPPVAIVGGKQLDSKEYLF